MGLNVHVINCEECPNVAPTYLGQHWIDETSGIQWTSIGTSSVDDWVVVSPVVVQGNLSNFTNYTESGYSGAIPMNTTVIATTSTMHDTTVSDSGTATGTQTTTTLKDTSKSWTVNEFTNYYVRTLAGTGSGRWRKISSNTADTLTITPAWTVTPVTASTTYEITELSTRLVAPCKGIYTINAMVGFEKPLTLGDTYGLRIDKNGTFNVVSFGSNSGVTEHEYDMTKEISMEKDDYIEIQAYQGSGSERKMYGSSRMFVTMKL